MYKAVIVDLKNVREHPNADRLQLATCCGCQVIVGIDRKDGDIGIYFPSDGQLSSEFAKANDLVRRKDKDGNNVGGMFCEKRRVRAQRLRGEVSDGFWIELSSLLSLGSQDKIDKLLVGTEFDEFNSVALCNKYVSPRTLKQAHQNQVKKIKRVRSNMFKEHFDTKHFFKFSEAIPLGSFVILTEKLHGTSGRSLNGLINHKKTLCQTIMSWFGFKKHTWEHLTGTRKVVLESNTQGYYSIHFRQLADAPFKDNLHKGETVYYEIVGWQATDSSIMPKVDPKKIKDKGFKKKYTNYENEMVYKYGCKNGKFEVYVYRITMTNESQVVTELSWEQVKMRCQELCVKHVPELMPPFINRNNKELEDRVTKLCDGPSVLDPTHIREGVAVRLEGRHMEIYKHKNFNFKVLEDIIKEQDVVDMEEAS